MFFRSFFCHASHSFECPGSGFYILIFVLATIGLLGVALCALVCHRKLTGAWFCCCRTPRNTPPSSMASSSSTSYVSEDSSSLESTRGFFPKGRSKGVFSFSKLSDRSRNVPHESRNVPYESRNVPYEARQSLSRRATYGIHDESREDRQVLPLQSVPLRFRQLRLDIPPTPPDVHISAEAIHTMPQ